MYRESLQAGILKELYPELHLDPQRRREIERELYGRDTLFRKLVRVSRNTLQELEVFETTDATTCLVNVASAAANHIVGDVLADARCVAVTWGNTIRELVRAIEDVARKRTSPSERMGKLEFVQVCGDPHGAMADPSLRGSTLVAKLNEALTNSPNSPYSFSVSASIPRRFSNNQVNTIRDFIREVGGYSNVFSFDQNGKQRLAVKIDTLLTSCGSGRRTNDGWLSECARVAAIEDEQLENLTVGNIGGYWLPRYDLIKKDRSLLEDINARWNGIVLDDIADIAQRRGWS